MPAEKAFYYKQGYLPQQKPQCKPD